MDYDLVRLHGVDAKRAGLLRSELGVSDLLALLYYFPFRYTDRRTVTKIGSIRSAGSEPVQVVARLDSVRVVDEGKPRMEAFFSDGTGRVKSVWFRGYQWVYKKLKLGGEYILFGRVGQYGGFYSFSHPDCSEYTPYMLSRLKLEPEYTVTDGLRRARVSSASLRGYVGQALGIVLPTLREYLPSWMLDRLRLPQIGWALERIHFPSTLAEVAEASRRLKYDELFLFQLLQQMDSQSAVRYAGHRCDEVGALTRQFYSERLPFDLTGAQKRVVREIRRDLGSGVQMNRLVQGDVGSGKTLVALFAMLIAADNGLQSALMAPTEILAQQHYKNITRFLGDLPVSVALLTGSTSARARRSLLPELAEGRVGIVVGTHALIEDSVQFARLGLIVVDEQHRFGVRQRARMWHKGSAVLPHILVMSATPIPRTLALTLYSDLAVSSIDELPPGRKPIVTRHVYQARRGELYEFVRGELAKGRQGYFVFPLISESARLELESLEAGYARLGEAFPEPSYRLGVLHGRMSVEEKERVMGDFSAGRIDLLVATTVVEVGVDVPNATIMVIEDAQRFGLAQLHQLRGRVGRGGETSYCFLVTGFELKLSSRKRIEAMESTNDGFKIAALDLQLRGFGTMEGTKQSGHEHQFRIARLDTDGALVSLAHAQAGELLAKDPGLDWPEHAALRSELALYRAKSNRYGKIG